MQWRTNKLFDLRKDYANELYPLYGKKESEAMLNLLVKRYFNLSRSDLAANPEFRLSESEILRLHFAVNELKNHRPIQYILKHVDFLNAKILVNESVLIPRPETEELVQLILKNEKQNEELRVLDIGTGSGCIAISLAKNLKHAQITGIDVSEEALTTAGKNSFINEVFVSFTLFDILNPDSGEDLGNFDILVSNPPYVTKDDKKHMKENVMQHEPHLALFVEGDDPLLFYHAILYFALDHLRPGGRIYFEINEAFGSDVTDLLKKSGFKQVELHKDIFSKDRFVSALKESH